MTLISASIIYGTYYATIPSDDFAYYNPTLIQYHISSYALIVLIFSIFGLICMIFTLAIYYLKPDSKPVFYIISGSTGVLLVMAIIFEGVFYTTVYNDFTYHSDTQFINNSKARSYVKKSLEALYVQALKNLQEEFPNETFFKTHDWKAFKKLLGQKINNTDDHPYQHLIQYADLWGPSSKDNKDHLVFNLAQIQGTEYYYISASYDSFSFPVATITFNYSSGYKKYYHLGYFDEKKIKYIDYKDDPTLYPFKPVCTRDNRSLQIDVTLIDGKYISSYRAYRENYVMVYKFSDFPIAFKLLNHQQAKDAIDDPNKFIVEEASNQIGGFNIKKLLKKKADLNLKINKTTFYNCSHEIKDDKDLKKHCHLDKLWYPYEYEDPTDTPFYNVGYRPHFQKASASEIARNLVFYYKDYFTSLKP